ncbi:5-amino-6-(D-ribitylamino)uracil--L-tyrosine 4-hydroxyphenyl transferase CofH [Ramlibacter tataouinensis]|uniref:5-amino-6-(D-ribitylamino)uracil--L-tyrosine 4-hydroxyphenyl transferase CofH n=1 Tax=Ramlibacter tataouinensis TaxID=94132 RepID=UPI0022F38261|nr:5-amino-6-(D-ribitylamino)uracil--L-tyrosine 4-hydroxyphenyl transferase CofH [Ramlibacter tataouinensis]WBY00534.1 5-amino-6-(D-ribitylamino)uracil--L-tyrosine 4-hydroxyphenyl transferase CofH [Ramlibacter tataouinensis]
MNQAESERELLREPVAELARRSGAIARLAWGDTITYSPKVFVPLTKLCRDLCGYCTFSRDHSVAREKPYMDLDEVLAVARDGEAAGCHEALFTLGDKPELRYPRAQEWLRSRGYATTVEYLARACGEVAGKTALLPHVNAGVLSREELAALREVSVSMGLMLEVNSPRFMQKGMPHYRSPDKDPQVRMRMLREAGELRIPITTGLLIGIGETREERLQTLRDIRDLHEEFGHIQEVIVQNFCPKAGTPMLDTAPAPLEEQLWTIAAARHVLQPEVSIQSPPNLRPGEVRELLEAGINDLGGISPVTADHVNPEAAWPQIEMLRGQLDAAGFVLAARLPLYPAYVRGRSGWVNPAHHRKLLMPSDTFGLAREDRWFAGGSKVAPPAVPTCAPAVHTPTEIGVIVSSAQDGQRLSEHQIATLFQARGNDYARVVHSADQMRREHAGDVVRHVINRNINYTNICAYRCSFCAFSKRTGGNKPTETPYDLDVAEVVQRAREAVAQGATEVCMQGGIHPSYDGNTYLGLLSALKAALPDLHVHAFSPLEVLHGATTLGLSTAEFLQELKRQGLGSLPGTAAEILSDDVRDIICPDKVTTAQWLRIVGEAHQVGLPTTSTIMFGHVEEYGHWARHILSLRGLQERTGGITEFVPLPFVHVNSPVYKRGQSRRGPTWRETVLMYAVSRLALSPLIPNIQTSWVKLGPLGAQRTLQAGANDFGGVLMNESISRAAGAEWGQGVTASQIQALLQEIGRTSEQRTTLYQPVEQTPAPARRLARIPVVIEGAQAAGCPATH